MNANGVVSRDRIIAELWGEQPPPTVEAGLNVYISRLRKLLASVGAEDSLRTQDPGYVLTVRRGQLDADRFRSLADEGRRSLEAGDYDAAGETLEQALALWRGPALADLRDEEFARASCDALEDRRLAALIDRIAADLQTNRNADLVGELETLVREHPFHERLWGELMLALYRDGRQADALAVYQRARETLDAVGVEPSPELKRLHVQILNQDAHLNTRREPADETERVISPRRRRLTLGFAAASLVAAAIAIVLLLALEGRGRSAAAPLLPDSVRVIDPKSDRPIATIPVGGTPGAIAIGDAGLWVIDGDDETIREIDPVKLKITRTIGAPGVHDIAVGAGAVWAGGQAEDGFSSRITRIPVNAPDLRTVIPIRQVPSYWDPAELPHLVTFAAGSVWTVDGRDGIARIDRRSDAIVKRVRVPGGAAELTPDGASLWYFDGLRLVHLDARSGNVIGQGTPATRPGGLAIGYGSVWVTDNPEATLWRVNRFLVRGDRTTKVGEGPAQIATGAGAVWVANSLDGTISKVDPSTGSVVATVRVGFEPTHILFAKGKLWVTVR